MTNTLTHNKSALFAVKCTVYRDIKEILWLFYHQMTSIKIKAHEHKLSYRNTLKLSATKGHTGWTCDACRRNSKELQQTHSYNCSNCDFDLCKECTQPVKTSKHPHKMVVTNANKIYENGAWGCDNCGTNSSSQGK